MEYPMKLHTDTKLFGETIRATSQHSGIRDVFVEKDYWITLLLFQLANSKYASQMVFKGGTSLSKGYGLINRFSEDVDIAIIDGQNKSGNEVKTIIRAVEKEMAAGLVEKHVEGVSSKGSKFRRSIFEYPSIDPTNFSNTLIVEINSFANPFPFQRLMIQSLIRDFLLKTGNVLIAEQYGITLFEVNVLSKEQTLLEKLTSLVRFSFDEDPRQSIASKIRHFYDLYYLMIDADCAMFVRSAQFKERFEVILQHDRKLFDTPLGWSNKHVYESPLVADFENVWKQLRDVYRRELSALAYAPIPDEKQIKEQFSILIKCIQ
jgi:predicted nucleotidyltransferase component of viral defense system